MIVYEPLNGMVVISDKVGVLTLLNPIPIAFDPREECLNCGYGIGIHQTTGPCPDEIGAMRAWGLM